MRRVHIKGVDQPRLCSWKSVAFVACVTLLFAVVAFYTFANISVPMTRTRIPGTNTIMPNAKPGPSTRRDLMPVPPTELAAFDTRTQGVSYRASRKRNKYKTRKEQQYDPPIQLDPYENIPTPNVDNPFIADVSPLDYDLPPYLSSNFHNDEEEILPPQNCNDACERKNYKCQAEFLCIEQNGCIDGDPASGENPVCRACKQLQEASTQQAQLTQACDLCARTGSDCRICSKISEFC